MTVHIEQSFSVKRPPEVVFDYIADPSNRAAWQSTRATVDQLTDGPLRRGTRLRERAKALGVIPVVQVSEITEFERPALLEVTAREGPVLPLVGRYAFEPDGDATRVHCSVDYALTGRMRRMLGPLTKRMIERRLAGDHRRLVRVLEAPR